MRVFNRIYFYYKSKYQHLHSKCLLLIKTIFILQKVPCSMFFVEKAFSFVLNGSVD